jgi:adenylate cyclase
VVFSITPFGHRLDETIGLDLLFKVRGQRTVPSDVIIVSIDSLSSDILNLPEKPDRWPHSLHARLVDILYNEGAKVIAFDIFFRDQRDKTEARRFADAMRKAGNVVLVETIKRERIVLGQGTGSSSGDITIEKLIPPFSWFAESAIALAPFPLPKVPQKVNQYWTFKETAGNAPSLPVISFQIFMLDVYEEFSSLLQKVVPSEAAGLPGSREEFLHTGSVVKTIKDIRDIFERNLFIAGALNDELRKSKSGEGDAMKMKRIRSLINMYQSPRSNYLNFYGFPRTIQTIPFYKVLRYNSQPDKRLLKNSFKDKMVFIGSSEQFQPAQRDGFYTVFTQPDGLDISGVEIAATAFANLLEDMPVQPVSFYVNSIIIFIWGLVIGILNRSLSTIYAAVSGALLIVLYFMTIIYQFTQNGIWYPLVVPIFFQAPVAFIAAFSWKYIETNRERQNIKKAFSFYLPDEVVNRISADVSDFEASSQVVYGTCLSTDADNYTSLSENMNPQELNSFMNKYYQAVFSPVKQHGGIVANVIADAMLAIWVTGQTDTVSRKNACCAALGIRGLVNEPSAEGVYLPTRIGLHSGHISIGNIGAGDHYEYRPVGDIVNTSTRIEGMNKYLGTRILLSGEVLNNIEDFLTREVGSFLLAGKTKPLNLYELFCHTKDCTDSQNDLCSYFAEARELFKERLWDLALKKFTEIIEKYGKDGPTLFYLKLCEKYKNSPPEAPWDTVIRFDTK